MSNDRLQVIAGTPMSPDHGFSSTQGYLVQTNGGTLMGTESERVAGFGRLEDGLRQAGEWYRWGPYVSERQWGTVRVARWLDGDPGQPPPPPQRQNGRNARWRGFDAFDIMSMPDKWEYPRFAAWDLAFHAVALAHVDPAFAKYQLILLCRASPGTAGSKVR